jgi:hypothetical protein
MVMQYRKKGSTRWRDYPGKAKLGEPISKYEWRLLNKEKTKRLWPPASSKKGYSTYIDVLSNLRRIEFFKRNRAIIDPSELKQEILFGPREYGVLQYIPGTREAKEAKFDREMQRIWSQINELEPISTTQSFMPENQEDKEWDQLMIKVAKGELTGNEAVSKYILDRKTKRGSKKTRKRNRKSWPCKRVYKNYKTSKKGGQHYRIRK